jgi:hypothetical protein
VPPKSSGELQVEKPFQITFSGKWKPAFSGTQLPDGDFQTLTNMRYTDAPGIKSVLGISKINTTAYAFPTGPM